MSSGTMYALKPLITKSLTIKSEDNCMYKMKNIHEICSSDDHASKFCNNVTDISKQNPLPEVAVLEARQEKILAQLAELKEQVLCLCDVLKSNKEKKELKSCSKSHDPIVLDLIVKANPKKPCWTILALHNLWEDVNFSVTCYRHSSTEEIEPEFKAASKTDFHDTVNVTLIWKKVEDTEIIVPEVQGYPLVGESNFLRYLVRKLYDKNYEKVSNQREIGRIENILDISHRLQYEESSKNVHSMLTRIGELLGENKWLSSHEHAGIADVAAWSTIKNASIKKLPSCLSSWFEQCEKTFLK